ncbi:Tetratrico peptide repeat-containing protein [Amycolatopsis arida]|uniref:Tetratrico peptide repeat-containing protein n=1 Tax=Amycolatopsis arida TaxID=587909 RepID=A0A1I5WKG5_9PSEU|nr:tetratricopeptide repeat protein [Amycolatopsis arida]TDX92331.1 tetratricopeptide repeat protein [Amycolatopsis arida]SFQ20255.1 Tetratrico peptide repeat-containing protein [Amycolatopsis arida]
MTNTDWERRVALLWDSFDERSPVDFLREMEKLVAEVPEDDPVGLYEHGSAFDSTDQPDQAVERYRRALANGLSGSLRRQAVIQLASSLRNLGQAEESVRLLTEELDRGSDELDDAVRAFLALALTSAGREREAVSVALTALVPHLPRYQRSLTDYARELG